jgi:hypothetical protein
MSSYVKPTDTANKIQLESHLLFSLWTFSRAHAGQEAGLEVKTALVGHGAKVKITCKTVNGKNLAKTEGVVYNNIFLGKILVPEKTKTEEMIFFEAELPKHGLKGESNAIPVRPPIKITELKWDRKEVKRDDVVTLTCRFESGVEDDDDATVVIYEYNPNSVNIPVISLPTKIKDNKIELQWKFTYQDDTAKIPTSDDLKPYKKTYKNPQFYFAVGLDGVVIGDKQESGFILFKDLIEMELQTEQGRILPDHPVVLHYADGTQEKLKTDGKGCIRIPEGPPGPVTVEIPDDPSEE